MKCWLFVLKQFIKDLKESIKAVIVCVQIIPIILIFNKCGVKMLTICPENSYILSYFF